MTITYKKGDSDIRPWGTWEVLEASEHFCVKKMCAGVYLQSPLSVVYHLSVFRGRHRPCQKDKVGASILARA